MSERQGKNAWTWWPNNEVGHTQEATQDLKHLFSHSVPVFDFPKPVRLIKRVIELAAQKDDIVLDFFSGSATTAHAVMQLNAEDGGNRKFIMVQIPEPTAPDSEAFKAGYRTIAEIGKERIRRAGDKIKAEAGMLEGNLDTGFRVFKLDSSNLKKWDDTHITPNQIDLLVERMEQSLDVFKPDRRAIDVVYEVFLKYGVPLTEKLATLTIQGKTFYVVREDGYIFICLDADITVSIVEEAAQYAPGTMIFSDACFENDDELTNAALVLEKAKIEFRWV